MIETHRSFVNTWECDENAHMNVQFYMKRFDEAARFFALAHGGDHMAGLPPVRHVRYHSELAAAQSAVVRSGVIASGPLAGRVVHRMEENATGRLCATALDGPGAPESGAIADEAEAAPALPRSIDPSPRPGLDKAAMLAAGGVIAHRCIVTPAECDAKGRLTQQFHISRFTDGAPHVWDHAGISTRWLNDNGLGRVAVEMQIRHHNPAMAGDALILVSRAETGASKTIRLHHELFRATDGMPVASGEVVGLVMDLATRKSVKLELQAAG
ncbi:thioesterase family protein [Zhengella sp. ZM62]|uniref:thioesterase family protein n=1 Tax=Zhengella sedimenti TaxID=3390035 RepID=UPI003975BF2B